jgi:hypothetical protein
MKNTYIKITDLWLNGNYASASEAINKEDWSSKDFAKFCAYFAKYCGLKELNILWKFL